MRELWSVIANEWMKLVHRRRFLITAILSLLILGIYGIGEFHERQNFLRYDYIQNMQSQVQSMQHQLQVEQASNDPNKNQELANLRQQLNQMESSLKLNQELQSANWKPAVEQEIAMHQATIATINKTPASSDMQKVQNQVQVLNEQSMIRQLQYSVNHNVKPYPMDARNPYMETLNFLSVAATIFFPMLIVILISDMISGESTSGTIKLLLVRPVSRTKILLGKWIVSIFSATIWTIPLCVLLQAISMGVWGASGGAQPTLTGVSYTFRRVIDTSNPMGGAMPQIIPIPNYAHSHIISQWELFLFATLFMVLAMVVVATITFLFSALFKSAMASTATAMGIIVVGFVITRMANHSSWIRWVFSTHLDLVQNWTGQLSMSMNQSVTLNLGILVLCVWGIVTLLASLVVFARRDILNA